MNAQTTAQEPAQNVQKEDLFTRYEVQPNGYVVNERGKGADEILAGLKAKIDPALFECLDYASPATDYALGSKGKGAYEMVKFNPSCYRLIVYTAQGTSEGWYLHVDMIQQDGTLKNLILFKTLEFRPDNIKALERAVWDLVAR